MQYFIGKDYVNEMSRRSKILEKAGPIDSTKIYVAFEDPDHVPEDSIFPVQQRMIMSTENEVSKQLKEMGYTQEQIESALTSGCFTIEDATEFINNL